MTGDSCLARAVVPCTAAAVDHADTELIGQVRKKYRVSLWCFRLEFSRHFERRKRFLFIISSEVEKFPCIMDGVEMNLLLWAPLLYNGIGKEFRNMCLGFWFPISRILRNGSYVLFREILHRILEQGEGGFLSVP